MEQRVKTTWVLVVSAAICAATAGFFSLKFLLKKEPSPQPEKQSSSQIEGRALSRAAEPNDTDQGIAAIKKEEVRVAERLIKDFPGDENPLIIMGEVWRRYGNAVEATEFYKRALEINPMRPDAHVAISEFCIKEGNFTEAISHWRKVLDMQPRAQLMHGYIGEALLMLNKPAEAIEELEKEVRVTPYSSHSYVLIGRSYLQLEEYEKAKENYEAAVKSNPENPDAYYGLMTVCTKLGDREKAKEYSDKFRRVKAKAREAVKAEKVKYDDIVETRKRSALTYIRAAEIYRIKGKLHTAEELLNRAMVLDPESAVCLLDLAGLYQKDGRRAKALEVHALIREMEIENFISLLDFGVLSVDLQRFDDAEKAFLKAIELAPQNPTGYYKLALLYLTVKKKFAQAKRFAEKAAELEETAVNYSLLSRACIMNGDGAGALQAIKRALELDPHNREYQRYYDLIRRMN